MFTGIIQESALVQSFEKSPNGDFWILYVDTNLNSENWNIGDSISNNGVCLTIVEKSNVEKSNVDKKNTNKDSNFEMTRLRFDVGPETMNVTNFASIKKGDGVHLEPALKMGDPLGGHLVSGHIDTVANVSEVIPAEDILTLGITISGNDRHLVAPFMVKKGSVAMNGASLTINEMKDDSTSTTFYVTLIPHTLELTHFSNLKVNDQVNIEADIMAKQAARYAEYWKENNA